MHELGKEIVKLHNEKDYENRDKAIEDIEKLSLKLKDLLASFKSHINERTPVIKS